MSLNRPPIATAEDVLDLEAQHWMQEFLGASAVEFIQAYPHTRMEAESASTITTPGIQGWTFRIYNQGRVLILETSAQELADQFKVVNLWFAFANEYQGLEGDRSEFRSRQEASYTTNRQHISFVLELLHLIMQDTNSLVTIGAADAMRKRHWDRLIAKVQVENEYGKRIVVVCMNEG